MIGKSEHSKDAILFFQSFDNSDTSFSRNITRHINRESHNLVSSKSSNALRFVIARDLFICFCCTGGIILNFIKNDLDIGCFHNRANFSNRHSQLPPFKESKTYKNVFYDIIADLGINTKNMGVSKDRYSHIL